MNKIWKRFKKVNGSSTKPTRHALIINGQAIHDLKEISNKIGENLQNISSNNFYEEEFKRHKERTETQDKIKFNNE